MIVQPDVGDVPARRLVEDGLGRGAEGGPVGQQHQALQLGDEVEGGVGLNQVIEQTDRQLPGRDADLFLVIAVDDVVIARRAGPPRLAPGGGRTGLALELERHVLGDVTHPGAVTETLDEAAGPVQRAAVVVQTGQEIDQCIGEGRQGVRGPVLEHAEIDEQPDRRLVGPVVGAPQDLALEDLEVGTDRRLVCRGFALGILVALDSRFRARIAHSDALRSSSRRRRRSGARPSMPSAATRFAILLMRLWASWATRSFLLPSSGSTRRPRRSNR